MLVAGMRARWGISTFVSVFTATSCGEAEGRCTTLRSAGGLTKGHAQTMGAKLDLLPASTLFGWTIVTSLRLARLPCARENEHVKN